MNQMIIVQEDAVEPLTLAQAAVNMHVPKVNGVYHESARITKLIKVARLKCENYTGLSIIKRTVEIAHESFYYDDSRNARYRRPYRIDITGPSRYDLPRIMLDYGPVGTVDSVMYTDSNGVTQTLASDQYRVDRYTNPPSLVPAYGVYWPITRADFDAVRVQYKAGFEAVGAPQPALVPEDIKQAMLLYIGHYFENREAVAPNTLAELPLGAIHLLEPYRTGLGV